MKLKRLQVGLDAARTKDLGNGIVEAVVSTNSLDRHGERLSIKGLDIKQYNGVVLLNHDYGSLPIGKSTYLKKKVDGNSEQLISRTEFAVDQYPLAETVYKLVKDGFMPDVSIGFIPKDWDEETLTWTKSEMVEYSHVTVGANRDAKVTSKGLESIGVTEDEFEEEVIDFMKKNGESQLKMVTPDETVEEEEDDDSEDDLEIQGKAIKATASALDSTLSADTEVVEYGDAPRKRKIVLAYKARKQAQALDRLVETLIGSLKKLGE